MMSLWELEEKISEFQAIYPLQNKTQKGEKTQDQISCDPQEYGKWLNFQVIAHSKREKKGNNHIFKDIMATLLWN